LNGEGVRETAAVQKLIEQLGNERVEAARAKFNAMKPGERQTQMRKNWTALLGNIEPAKAQRVGPELEDIVIDKVRIERHQLSVEPGIVVPLVLLVPPQAKREKVPVVIGVAQSGKQAFVNGRADIVAAILRNGIAVALPDVRGTGETSPGATRDRHSAATSISSTGLMTGQPLLGAQVRDLRTVMRYLPTHPQLDAKRLALWGDTFTSPLDAEDVWKVPHGVDDRPVPLEPLGGLLALLGALYEDDVRAVFTHGSLASFTSTLASPFCYLPHDAIVPGVLQTGDLTDLAATLSPRSLRMCAMVDGVNRRIGRLPMEKAYDPTRSAYRAAKADQALALEPNAPSANELARWFATHLAM
jgi:hypothetical protein